MKITVDLSDSEIRDVLRFSGEKKKGPAIRKFIVDELMLRRRREISRKVLKGEWTVELPPIEKIRKDREL
jgi:hypothetical protein